MNATLALNAVTVQIQDRHGTLKDLSHQSSRMIHLYQDRISTYCWNCLTTMTALTTLDS